MRNHIFTELFLWLQWNLFSSTRPAKFLWLKSYLSKHILDNIKHDDPHTASDIDFAHYFIKIYSSTDTLEFPRCPIQNNIDGEESFHIIVGNCS